MSPVPRVSAVIIVLDGEAFIGEAIDSVRAQTFDDWELLIVDDGSTDGTLPLVQRYARADPRIRLVRHGDHGTHGMSASRNLGIAKSRGDFIAFLDSDDVWLPAKLSEQLSAFDHNPDAAMVYGRTLIWNRWSAAAGAGDFYYDLGVRPDELHRPPRLFLQLLRNRDQSPTTCNAIVRRRFALEVGGFDPRFRDMFEDQLFFAKLLLLYPAYVSGRCWAKYRQHPSSASARADPGEVPLAQLRYLRALREFARKHRGGFSIERVALERAIAAVAVGEARRRVRARLRTALAP